MNERTRITQLEGRQSVEIGPYQITEAVPFPKLIGMVCQAGDEPPTTIVLNRAFVDALMYALHLYRPLESDAKTIDVGPMEGSGVWP